MATTTAGIDNCTLTAGGRALAFHTQGALDKWGGHLRHRQNDLEGGTGLDDLAVAWDSYGENLRIRSGAGWSGVKEDREDGRAIVLQGQGNTPGQGTFTGAHAILVLPDQHSSGEWLIGDPLCNDYQWVPEQKLKDWAKALCGDICYATSKAQSTEPEPSPPEPVPAPPQPAPLPSSPPWAAPGAWQPVSASGDPWDAAAWSDSTWWAVPGTWGVGWG